MDVSLPNTLSIFVAYCTCWPSHYMEHKARTVNRVLMAIGRIPSCPYQLKKHKTTSETGALAVLVVDSGFEHDQWTMRGLQDGALRLQASIWEARKTRHVDFWRMVKDGEGWWRYFSHLQPGIAVNPESLQRVVVMQSRPSCNSQCLSCKFKWQWDARVWYISCI